MKLRDKNKECTKRKRKSRKEESKIIKSFLTELKKHREKEIMHEKKLLEKIE